MTVHRVRWLFPRLLILGTVLLAGCVAPGPVGTPTPPPAPEPTPAEPIATAPAVRPTPIPVDPSIVVWSADMETGDLSQWTIGGTRGGPFDSGSCRRPEGGVTSEVAHSGRYAAKMTIDVSQKESGCRLFRHLESENGKPYYYSAWMMIPTAEKVEGYWNIFQFKSENDKMNEAVWVVEARNRPDGSLHTVLRWKGLVRGPTQKDGTDVKYFDQALIDIPIGRWFHLEAFLAQSEKFDGHITVWQDGVQLWDLDRVKTRYPGGDNRWSVNNYGEGLEPARTTVYVDDAMVTTARVSATLPPPATAERPRSTDRRSGS